jgi:hypothetical protein
LEFGTVIEIEEAVAALIGGLGPRGPEAAAAPADKLGLEAPVIKGSSAMDSDNADFIYD